MATYNEWWDPSDTNRVKMTMEQASEEYGSEMFYKDFEANITNAMLNALENELVNLDLIFAKKPNNIITVSGRDEDVLNGTRLLDAFREYDRNARRLVDED